MLINNKQSIFNNNQNRVIIDDYENAKILFFRSTNKEVNLLNNPVKIWDKIFEF